MSDPAWLESLRPLVNDAFDRFAQLATRDLDGHPRCRTVVVREMAAPGEVLFTADTRSAKAAQIEADPRAELCWYLPKAWHQFRLAGRLSAASDDARARMWGSLSDAVRLQFCHDGEMPAHFAVYALDVSRVDTLDLTVLPFARHLHERAGDAWRSTAIDPV